MEKVLAHPEDQEIITPDQGKLHTDKLPPTSPVIDVHNEDMRIADLEDTEGISRTHALTFFADETAWPEEVKALNEKIKAGASIGKTFRAAGYEITKNEVDHFQIALPDWLKERFKTDEEKSNVRAYEFYVRKSDTQASMRSRP
jgi:hypothetical protein